MFGEKISRKREDARQPISQPLACIMKKFFRKKNNCLNQGIK